MDVLIRQAHPGPAYPAYRSLEQKLENAQTYRREEDPPYPVLADDLEGTVHQVYGMLADPCYLLDADGRVAYYNMWTHAPTLHRVISALVAQDGRGVVLGGVDRIIHLWPALTEGWRGLRRGLPQSFIDMETAAPGMASGPWLGFQLRPLLAPITLRAEPLPRRIKLALAAGAAVAAGVPLALAAGRRESR